MKLVRTSNLISTGTNILGLNGIVRVYLNRALLLVVEPCEAQEYLFSREHGKFMFLGSGSLYGQMYTFGKSEGFSSEEYCKVQKKWHDKQQEKRLAVLRTVR